MAVGLADELFADLDMLPKGKGKSDAKDLYHDLSNPWVMLTFYRRLFPCKEIFEWLNQGIADKPSTKLFTHREFAFTLSNDAYLRYCSFQNVDAFRAELLRLNPSRFEIGPVYTHKPRDRKTVLKSNFKPILREFVLDIDMTDYDEIRKCCSGGNICKKCWKFIAMAVKVLDYSLKNDFGFEHFIWVYSGRRGIHCWISDEAALAMTDEQRKAIANYLDVVKGGAKQDKKVNLHRPLHPSTEAAFENLKGYFKPVILQDQDAFRAPDDWAALLKLINDRDIVNGLTKKWSAAPEMSSEQRWKDLRAGFKTYGKSSNNKSFDPKEERFRTDLEDAILQYTYPRIDIEVSKHLNHLLKSPFVIHPGTGRVCVPVRVEDVDTFDPTLAPTVGNLLQELEGVEESKTKDDYMRTKLRPYVQHFQEHIAGIVKKANARQKKAAAESYEF